MKRLLTLMILSTLASFAFAQNIEPLFITNEDKGEESLKLSALRLESAYYHAFVQRAEYCSNIGEPINNYVSAYQRENQKIHAIAISILRKNWNPKQGEFSEDTLFKKLSSSIPAMEKRMKDLADKRKISEKDLCKWFNNNIDETVKKVNLTTISPDASQVVLNSPYNN